jgi:hypothetical protein
VAAPSFETAASPPLRMRRFTCCAPSLNLTMSNSAVFFVPAARCCVRVCPSLHMCLCFTCAFALHVPSLSRPPASPRGLWRQRPSRQQQFRPPDEGWMERRQAHSLTRSRLRRATTRPGATGTPLGAPPWRFSAGAHACVSGSGTPEPPRLPAPRHKAWRSGSGPPGAAVRAAAAGRHSLLRLAGSFLENAPSEPGCKSYTTNSIRSQHLSSYRRRYFGGHSRCK